MKKQLVLAFAFASYATLSAQATIFERFAGIFQSVPKAAETVVAEVAEVAAAVVAEVPAVAPAAPVTIGDRISEVISNHPTATGATIFGAIAAIALYRFFAYGPSEDTDVWPAKESKPRTILDEEIVIS